MKLSSAAIWVWWCTAIMVVVMLSLSVVKNNEVKKQQQLDAFTTVTFDLNDGLSGYSEFLTNLRNAVEAPTRACGLQSTRSTPLKGKEYVYAELKFSNTEWVTLGIDVIDLYVWGYKDNFKYNKGKYRSTFFDNTPQAAKNSLFQEATLTRSTSFSSTYISLERYAKIERVDLILKLKLLQDAINDVYGKPERELNNAKEAKFVLIAIQMVAEAARFKFIDHAIVTMDTSSKAFRVKMVAFQNDWDPISQAIHKAEAATPKCVAIIPTLVISTIDYRQEVNRVDQINGEMGLLKYKDNTLHTITSSLLDADNGVVANDQNLNLDEL